MHKNGILARKWLFLANGTVDVTLANDVMIKKRSSRMALHSVTHCSPTPLCLKFGAVASQPQVGRKHVHAAHADNAQDSSWT